MGEATYSFGGRSEGRGQTEGNGSQLQGHLSAVENFRGGVKPGHGELSSSDRLVLADKRTHYTAVRGQPIIVHHILSDITDLPTAFLIQFGCC